MRRDNRRSQIDEGLDAKKMLYIIGSILSLAVIVFVITFLIYSNELEKSTQLGSLDTNNIGTIKAEDASIDYGKTVNEMQNEITNEVANNDDIEENKSSGTNTVDKIAINTSVNQTDTKPKNEETKPEEKEEKIPDPEFQKPISGDIIKEFAENKLVYSSTLDVWSTHNGIDIQAEKTTVVKASAEGKVTSIKNDPRYGLTVIIEHANGYKTVYANLLSSEFVVEGEEVKQGQSIGTVGNTASFEISDEPHLHFELLKNNEQQDPELYLN